MIEFVLSLIFKDRSVKHLLRLQREVRDLRKTVAELEKQGAERVAAMRKISEAVKAECRGFYWH